MTNSGNSKKSPDDCALTRTLVDLDFSSVHELIEQHETCTPSVLWNPSRFDITHPIIRDFAQFMQTETVDVEALSDAGMVQEKAHSFAPWIMVLEPVSEGSDFKYLQYGSEIAAMFGRDLKGGYTSEIGGHISEFFIALYSAVMVRKQSVLSVHVPPMGVFATVWRRLIFPVLDVAGEVQVIAAVNVADNELRAGLEALPDPALVAGNDGTLMYANASARRLFGEPTLPRSTIADYCDMDIELPDDAEFFATAESSRLSKIVGARNQVVVHFELRTSATFFRGTPYFIVQLKPY